MRAEGPDGRDGGLLRQLHEHRPRLGRRIAWQLEADGYTVVVQGWDFTAGRDWAHEMQQATSTAERVVAVLSSEELG